MGSTLPELLVSADPANSIIPRVYEAFLKAFCFQTADVIANLRFNFKSGYFYGVDDVLRACLKSSVNEEVASNQPHARSFTVSCDRDNSIKKDVNLFYQKNYTDEDSVHFVLFILKSPEISMKGSI